MDIQEVVQVQETGQANQMVAQVPIGNIITNPFQPRKVFATDSLRELADSIKEYGVLQPLLVVPLEGGQYLLIAGERRLRAAYIAQLETVPVLLGNYSSQEVAEIAMIENLQREDLHFLDEAGGYELLMREFEITQERLAARIGKKQSTIANKLRVLKLSQKIRDLLRASALTERHARAVLKLEDEARQLAVLQAAVDNELNVRQTEELVESMATALFVEEQLAAVKPGGKHTKVIRDVRIFVNSIKKVVADIKKIGLKVKLEQKETEKEMILTMKLPLGNQPRKAASAGHKPVGGTPAAAEIAVDENVSRETNQGQPPRAE